MRFPSSLMTRPWWVGAFGFCLCLLWPSTVDGQSSCYQALAKDKATLNLQESTSLAILELLKRTSGSSDKWAASVTVPLQIGAVPISAERAQSETQSYFHQSSLNWTQERLVSVATQTLSTNAVKAYKICVDGSHRTGPRVIVSNATSTEVTVQISWAAPPHSPSEATLHLGMSGGTLADTFPTRWKSGEAASRIVTREATTDLRITVDIGGETTDEFVSYIPPAATSAPQLLIANCTGKGGFSGIRFWGPASEYCNGVPPWGRYDAEVQVAGTLGSCQGKGGLAPVVLYGPTGQSCAGLPEWGEYAGSYDVSTGGLAACIGRGSRFNGQVLWGPTGLTCGGIESWGTYSQFIKN